MITPQISQLIEPVARHLFGEPNHRLSKPDELRFGNNGSIAVMISGEKRGTYYDHEACKGGGVIDLVSHHKQVDARSASYWIKENFPEAHGTATPPQPSARRDVYYDYRDADGTLLFQVVRTPSKEFRCRRPDGKGGWKWNRKGVQPPLYRLPEILCAVEAKRTIIIVEGEKDADRLASHGYAATTCVGGAGKWTAELSGYIKGARVVVLPDNDVAGHRHANAVASSLQGTAADVRIIELPGLAEKGDISNWLDAGHTPAELNTLIERAPVWSAPPFTARLPITWLGEEDNHPPLDWLVRNLLPAGGLSVIYGAPGSSKTYFALDLALRVANDMPFHDIPTAQCGVLYVAGEGQSGNRQRMKAWRTHHKVQPGAPFGLVTAALNLVDNSDDLNDLLADMQGTEPTRGPIGLVVLDTLACMFGSGDENNPGDMNALMRNVRRLQEETGAHVMLVHHSGKDRNQGMRGSTVLLGACDVAIEVSKNEQGDFTAKVVKSRHSEPGNPIKYSLCKQTVGRDDDGGEITASVVAIAGPARSNPPTKAARKAFELLQNLDHEAGTSGDKCLGVPLKTWRENFYEEHQGSDEANKKAFQRASDSLKKQDFIRIDKDTVTLTGNPLP